MLTHIRTTPLLTRHLQALATLAALVLLPLAAPMAAPLAVVGFNVESDKDTDPRFPRLRWPIDDRVVIDVGRSRAPIENAM